MPTVASMILRVFSSTDDSIVGSRMYPKGIVRSKKVCFFCDASPFPLLSTWMALNRRSVASWLIIFVLVRKRNYVQICFTADNFCPCGSLETCTDSLGLNPQSRPHSSQSWSNDMADRGSKKYLSLERKSIQEQKGKARPTVECNSRTPFRSTNQACKEDPVPAD